MRTEIIEWTKEILLIVVIISVLMGALYGYTGRWPPLVVVESGSMQHSDDTSYIGVIDTGDIVLAKHSSFADITTYVKGRGTGYRTYGDYGDVIIYRPLGRDVTPVIHRAVLYLKWNSTGNSFDVPDLKYINYGSDYTTDSGSYLNIKERIEIKDYGYAHRTLVISVSALLSYPHPHSGYITAGDHNVAKGYGVDENSRICPQPVEYRWVVAKAVGEIPWFGLIKLSFSGTLSQNPAPANSWVMLFVSLALLIAVPMIFEKLWDMYTGKKKENGPEEPQIDDKDEEEDNDEGESLFTKGI